MSETDSNEWYYEVVYHHINSSDQDIKEFERTIRVKPSEMIHLQQMVKYSLPALHGWHALFNSEVVAPGGSNQPPRYD